MYGTGLGSNSRPLDLKSVSLLTVLRRKCLQNGYHNRHSVFLMKRIPGVRNAIWSAIYLIEGTPMRYRNGKRGIRVTHKPDTLKIC